MVWRTVELGFCTVGWNLGNGAKLLASQVYVKGKGHAGRCTGWLIKLKFCIVGFRFEPKMQPKGMGMLS